MARCFPYLPREGILGNVACGRASIGPIKPNGQTEKIESGSGKTNTEKLLKRKCSRNKEEDTKSKRSKLTKSSGDSRKVKVEEDESSGVSEEHGLPSCIRSPCPSFESVQASKTTSRTDCKSDNPQESKRKTIRIRLNVTKSEGPICGEKPSLASASSSQQNDTCEDNRPRHPGASQANNAGEDRQRHPVAAAPEASTSLPDLKKKEKDISTKVGKTRNKGSRRENKKMYIYEALTNGWAAPALPTEQSEFEDLDWLCTSTKSGRPNSSGAHSDNASAAASTCSASLCTMWPKAQCLPDVDVYALPYTIPF